MIGIVCIALLGAIALWQTRSAWSWRARTAAAELVIDSQRAAIERLVVRLNEKKAKTAAMLVAITDAHHAAQRGDVNALVEALRSATVIVAADDRGSA